MSCSNCCFLTWKQVSQEAGRVVWYSHLFQNFHSLLRSKYPTSSPQNCQCHPKQGKTEKSRNQGKSEKGKTAKEASRIVTCKWYMVCWMGSWSRKRTVAKPKEIWIKYVCMHSQSLSAVWFFATPRTIPHHGFCPWNFPDKNTRVDCHFVLQGIFPTQESSPFLFGLLHWQADSLPLGSL